MRSLLALVLVGCAGATVLPTEAPLPEPSRTRLLEARHLSDQIGEELWPGWRQAPFAVLLVEEKTEYLIGHPRPPADFEYAGKDPVLGRIERRPRQFAPNLLATFPLGGVPTIVIGNGEATGKRSTEWVLTILHEHFHQLQMAQRGYFDDVGKLDLAGGDQTGTWMLEFPFPYTDPAVARQAAGLAEVLRGVLAGTARYTAVKGAYLRLRSVLGERDQRYLAFQLWQEGVARFIELRAADLAVQRGIVPGAAFRDLPDALPYSQVAANLHADLVAELAAFDLPGRKRVAFYAIGAALALVLDKASPTWRSRYFGEPFTLDASLP